MTRIIQGDCLDVFKTLESESVDSVVTDPPYGIGFMGKAWDTFKPEFIAEKSNYNETRRPKTKPTSGKTAFDTSAEAGTYDRTPDGIRQYQDWCYDWAVECLRVLKPGGHLLASNSSRMYHRMACAIEDAGFEIRDMISWLYGSGFPKSLNIGKQVDKMQGIIERLLEKTHFNARRPNGNKWANAGINGKNEETLTKGTSEYEGWGTALKPACEPIVVARNH